MYDLNPITIVERYYIRQKSDISNDYEPWIDVDLDEMYEDLSNHHSHYTKNKKNNNTSTKHKSSKASRASSTMAITHTKRALSILKYSDLMYNLIASKYYNYGNAASNMKNINLKTNLNSNSSTEKNLHINGQKGRNERNEQNGENVQSDQNHMASPESLPSQLPPIPLLNTVSDQLRKIWETNNFSQSNITASNHNSKTNVTTTNSNRNVNSSLRCSDKMSESQRNKLYKKYKKRQKCRKLVVLLFGITLIAIGIFALALFLRFILIHFDNKCINKSHGYDTTWIKENPELRYYDKYCSKKVVNLLNYDYPCNCRSFAMLLPKNKSTTMHFGQPELELIFTKFTNLQGISFEKLSNFNVHFKITDIMVENLVHLKILSMQYLNLDFVTSNINKLIELEIFQFGSIDNRLTIPFDKLSENRNLKVVSIGDVPLLLNKKIGEEVCNLKLMRYWYVTASIELKSFEFLDCIADSWQDLYFFEMQALPIEYIPPKFWQLPQLHTALFDHSNLNQSVINWDTFLGFSNSLTYVTFYGNQDICSDGNIIINGVKYNGFGYLNYSSDDNMTHEHESSYVLDFIEEFDPCYDICPGSTSDATLVCHSANWGNGICNIECDIDVCNHDGGDCNQLCDIYNKESTTQCNESLWFNHECDSSCNTSQCAYDFHHCALGDHDNQTCIDYIYNYNYSDIDNEIGSYSWAEMMNKTDDGARDEHIICYQSWAEDYWCDSDCNIEECNFDGEMCDENNCENNGDNRCGETFYYLITISASIKPPIELITLDELCEYWSLVTTLVTVEPEAEDNCTKYFDMHDLNHNGYIGYWEAIVATADQWALTTHIDYEKKIQQIDCSFCLTNSSLYYW